MTKDKICFWNKLLQRVLKAWCIPQCPCLQLFHCATDSERSSSVHRKFQYLKHFLTIKKWKTQKTMWFCLFSIIFYIWNCFSQSQWHNDIVVLQKIKVKIFGFGMNVNEDGFYTSITRWCHYVTSWCHLSGFYFKRFYREK